MQGEGKSSVARRCRRTEDRTCSGAQATRGYQRLLSDPMLGGPGGWLGCDKSAQPANNNKSARGTYQQVDGREQVEQRRKRPNRWPESLLELGRGYLAGKAAIGSATQGTRWVVQVRESCLREGKSERDWGKSETGGGGGKYSSCFGASASASARPDACRGCRRRGAGDRLSVHPGQR